MFKQQDESRTSGLTRLIRAGDVELQVLERGQGLPVLLLHGFPLDHSMWDNQIESLSKTYRVIAPDLRGFGGSQVTHGVATMDQMADDVAALLDALEVNERVVLCGLSMGGYVAFEFWRKYLKRLRALVLCDTRAAADAPEVAEGRHDLADKILAEGNAPLADGLIPKLFAPATLQLHSSMTAIQRERILTTSTTGAAAALRGMAVRNDMRRVLNYIELPTLVVVGEHDAISSVEEMRSIAGAMPHAQFAVIPHAGHMTPLENPEAFQAAIEPFLEQLVRAD
jgi:3-oxoadipate enol-lactonase